MSDQERWEAFKAWLRQNGPWILGGLALGALGLAGYRWWEGRSERLALDASTQYEQIVQALDRDERNGALELIEALKRDHPSSPYVHQAELAAAGELVESGDLDGAAERLRRVMEQRQDPQLALVARLRLARVQLAQDKADDALATLNVDEPGAFAPRYHEVRGDVYFAKGDKVAALKEYRLARESASQGVVDTERLDLKIQDLVGEGIGGDAPANAAAGSAPAAGEGGQAAPAASAPAANTAPASAEPAARTE